MSDTSSVVYRKQYIQLKTTTKIKYIADISHLGLNDFKSFSEYDEIVLKNKVENYRSKLEEKWTSVLKVNREKERVDKIHTENLEKAQKLTDKAKNVSFRLQTLLLESLNNPILFEWESLKTQEKFAELDPRDSFEGRVSKIIKPISLLNGSNLLYLLEKHGYIARIDLKEAKIQNQT